MNIQEIMVSQGTSIKTAIKRLDETGKKILIVVDNLKLVGVITDGDIRRWILKNGLLDKEIINITNTKPYVLLGTNRNQAKKVFKQVRIDAIPIVNEDYEIIDIIFKDDLYDEKKTVKKYMDNPVVIMAGGKGTRLYPYTKIVPKPLIPVGDISILERIISTFKKEGLNNFLITINYKKNMIKAYMDEIEKDYQLTYVEEDEFLGTAGSLALLDGKIKETFFMSNCDILVDANYADILDFHKKKHNKITMVTSLKQYTIPYGIIQTDDTGRLREITEKPEYNFQVNTGFYVVEPEVIRDIPRDTYIDITDLMQKYVVEGERVGVYPITEKAWLDMGEFAEMKRMNQILGEEEE